MADIFLSYARADQERAKQIARALEARGWSVWWDDALNPGEHFRATIAEQLHSARCVVALWSKASINSDWVIDEAEDGRRKKCFVQVLIDDVLPPHGFRQIQAGSLIDWDGSDSGGFTRLCEGIEVYAEPQRPLVESSRNRQAPVAFANVQALPQSPAPQRSNRWLMPAMGLLSALVLLLAVQQWHEGVPVVSSAEIETDVRRILATIAPRLDTGGDVNVDFLTDIRGAMSARVAELGAVRPVRPTIPNGNLFDARPDDPRFAPLIAPLVNPYVAMGFQTTNYNRALQILLSDLATARTTIALPSALLDALPQGDSNLPSRESAITGTAAFDQNAFTFASAKPLLDGALKSTAGRPADSATLNLLADDLNAVVKFAKAYGDDYDRLRNAVTALVRFVALEAQAVRVRNGWWLLGGSVVAVTIAGVVLLSLRPSWRRALSSRRLHF